MSSNLSPIASYLPRNFEQLIFFGPLIPFPPQRTRSLRSTGPRGPAGSSCLPSVPPIPSCAQTPFEPPWGGGRWNVVDSRRKYQASGGFFLHQRHFVSRSHPPPGLSRPRSSPSRPHTVSSGREPRRRLHRPCGPLPHHRSARPTESKFKIKFKSKFKIKA